LEKTMARRNFWDSFYRSWEQGDRIYDRMRDLQQRKGLSDAAKIDQQDNSQYDASEFMDDAEKQGGVWDAENQTFKLPDGTSVAPTNTPTWDESTKSYQNGMGQPLKPKQSFTLGNETRTTRFSPDEVAAYKTDRYADVYERFGNPEKATSLRAQSQQMKLGKVQYEQAALQAKQAKNIDKIMKIQQQVASGKLSEEEGVSALVDATDTMNDDGITHGYTAVGDGNYAISEMRNNKHVGSRTANFDEIVRESLKYASPQMFAQMTQQENFDKNFKQNADQFGVTSGLARDRLTQDDRQFSAQMKQNQDNFITGLDFKMAEHNDELGLKRDQQDMTRNYYEGIIDSYRDGTRGGRGGANKATMVGATDDGIVYVGADGRPFTEPYPEGVTKDDLLPKATGIREGREDTKARDKYLDFVVANPDATPDELGKVRRNLGLDAPLQYGPPKAKAAPAPKAGGLRPQAKVGFREAITRMSPEEIEEKMANPLFNGQQITGEDQLYAAQVINGLRAGQKLTPGYLR
jgi:hypothetical protein